MVLKETLWFSGGGGGGERSVYVSDISVLLLIKLLLFYFLHLYPVLHLRHSGPTIHWIYHFHPVVEVAECLFVLCEFHRQVHPAGCIMLAIWQTRQTIHHTTCCLWWKLTLEWKIRFHSLVPLRFQNLCGVPAAGMLVFFDLGETGNGIALKQVKCWKATRDFYKGRL